MRNSFLSRGLLAVAVLAVAAASACYERMQPLFDVVVATGRALKNLVLDGFKLAAGDAEDFKKPRVWLVRAKAFMLRLAKRERPEVSGSWRMCPST
ncbi:hypothetical protein D9M73_106240 [compost metagenome]